MAHYHKICKQLTAGIQCFLQHDICSLSHNVTTFCVKRTLVLTIDHVNYTWKRDVNDCTVLVI